MAAIYGRKVTLQWGSTTIPGVREKGLTINGEAVNVTSDDDSGIQVLLSEDAEQSHEISLSGVSKSFALREAKAAGLIQEMVTLTYPDGYVITGTFNLGSYTEGIPYNEAVTFDATLSSTGPVTHTSPSI